MKEADPFEVIAGLNFSEPARSRPMGYQAYLQAMMYPCDSCKARPGEFCHKPSGARRPYHAPRMRITVAIARSFAANERVADARRELAKWRRTRSRNGIGDAMRALSEARKRQAEAWENIPPLPGREPIGLPRADDEE